MLPFFCFTLYNILLQQMAYGLVWTTLIQKACLCCLQLGKNQATQTGRETLGNQPPNHEHTTRCTIHVLHVQYHFVTGNGVWTGLNDLDIEGVFVLPSTGLEPAYTNWKRQDGEPDNKGDIQHCANKVQPSNNGQWKDSPCGNIMEFFCEYELP